MPVTHRQHIHQLNRRGPLEMLDSTDDTIRLVQGSDLDCVRSGLASAVACIDSAGGYVMAAEKRKNGRKKNRELNSKEEAEFQQYRLNLAELLARKAWKKQFLGHTG
jgi:hypothetical protein